MTSDTIKLLCCMRSLYLSFMTIVEAAVVMRLHLFACLLCAFIMLMFSVLCCRLFFQVYTLSLNLNHLLNRKLTRVKKTNTHAKLRVDVFCFKKQAGSSFSFVSEQFKCSKLTHWLKLYCWNAFCFNCWQKIQIYIFFLGNHLPKINTVKCHAEESRQDSIVLDADQKMISGNAVCACVHTCKWKWIWGFDWQVALTLVAQVAEPAVDMCRAPSAAHWQECTYASMCSCVFKCVCESWIWLYTLTH